MTPSRQAHQRPRLSLVETEPGRITRREWWRAGRDLALAVAGVLLWIAGVEVIVTMVLWLDGRL